MDMNLSLKAKASEYRVEKVLFEGKNCSVFKVLRKETSISWQRQYALKVLNSRSQLLDCIEEFESLMKMQSHRCVKVYNWEWVNNKPALLLDYIDGPTLFALSKRVLLSTQVKVYIIDEIYRGLIDLKTQGLVHGDLSPKNIMITQSGEIKLIDYGMANLYFNQSKYTLGFVAPEVIKGSKQNFQSDLYSLGCLAKFLDLPNELFYSLTHNQPELRIYKKPKLYAEAKRNLSQIIRRQGREIESTIKQASNQPQKLASSLVLFLSFVPFLLVGATHKPIDPSFLSIKTENWVKIQIKKEGIELLSPVEHFNITPGEHQIDWITARASGSLTISLQPSQSLVLRSKDFK